jgi:Tfp pilus assembly protein PilP
VKTFVAQLLSVSFLALTFAVLAQDATAPAADTAAYVFNPLKLKRDPFLPPDTLFSKETNELLLYELSEMNLVAILTGMGTPRAMLMLPSGNTHTVQKGDALGRNKGRVHQISHNELVVKEMYKDYKNRQKSSLTRLKLAD